MRVGGTLPDRRALVKPHGWNGGWLEVAFSKSEAVVLLRLLAYLSENEPLQRNVGAIHPVTKGLRVPLTCEEEKVADKAIDSMANHLNRVINARTRMEGVDFTPIPKEVA